MRSSYYHVVLIVDGTFCQAALKGKIQLKEQLAKYLGGDVQPGKTNFTCKKSLPLLIIPSLPFPPFSPPFSPPLPSFLPSPPPIPPPPSLLPSPPPSSPPSQSPSPYSPSLPPPSLLPSSPPLSLFPLPPPLPFFLQ